MAERVYKHFVADSDRHTRIDLLVAADIWQPDDNPEHFMDPNKVEPGTAEFVEDVTIEYDNSQYELPDTLENYCCY